MLSSWDDLRYLEAIERLGSAKAAGRELEVATSTVYRRIVTLEASVGFVCLVRGRGITPAGRELARLSRTTGTAIASIARRARDQREEIRGTVRVTTADGFGPLLVKPLAELAASFPNLRVSVDISNTGLSLRKHQAEVGLTVMDAPPATLVGRKMFPVHFAVYGSREVAADAASAANVRWVVLAPPLHTGPLGQWESDHVPSDRVAVATASRRLFVDLVLAGAGLGLLPMRLAATFPDLVEVRTGVASTASLTRPAWLLTHAAVRDDARVKAVMRVLSRHLKGQSA